jgi:hypothetical protein
MLEREIAVWAITGETGVSSETMAAVALGIEPNRRDHNWPHDVSDFGRCWKMVKACPGVREHFPAIAKLSPAWAGIIAAFDEIGASYEEEGRSYYDPCPKTYELVKKALGDADIFKGRSVVVTSGRAA